MRFIVPLCAMAHICCDARDNCDITTEAAEKSCQCAGCCFSRSSVQELIFYFDRYLHRASRVAPSVFKPQEKHSMMLLKMFVFVNAYRFFAKSNVFNIQKIKMIHRGV